MRGDKTKAAAIGRRIAEARASSGWTNATKFAAAIESDRNSIGRWERGEVVPSALNIEAISRVTRVSADWLLRGEATPEWSAVIDEWQRTRSRAPADVVAFFRSLPLAGYVPSLRFLDLAFTAWEHGLAAAEVVQIARETETARAI